MDFALFALANHVQRVKLEIVFFIKPGAFERREEHQDLTVRMRTFGAGSGRLEKASRSLSAKISRTDNPSIGSNSGKSSSSGGFPLLLFQDLLHLPPQLRQTTPNGFPKQRHVHTKVKVNEAVPHPGHLLPWHFGISFPDNLGQAFGGFADYLKFADHRTQGFVVLLKGCDIKTCGKYLNAVKGRQNILQV
jgi:hypothetical protein